MPVAACCAMRYWYGAFVVLLPFCHPFFYFFRFSGGVFRLQRQILPPITSPLLFLTSSFGFSLIRFL